MGLLIVDDDAAATDALAQLMEYEGASVMTANRGEDALSILAEQEFNVVLSDLGMPEMDGYELAQRIRALDNGAAPTLVALSGFSRPGDIQRAKEAGFDLHLGKPFSLDALAHLLEDAKKDAPA
jgi:two-component system CheB/CheR fusion protein